MTRIVVTILLMVAWHFPTTFFAPATAPNEHGWLVWPFGRASSPAFEGLTGAIAPSTPAALGSPTIAMAAAGLASLALIVAIAGLWGIVIPADWWRPAAIVGALSSMVLFSIYLSPLSVIPMLVDAAVLWGVVVSGWTTESLTGS
jgi:hypothetical protein